MATAANGLLNTDVPVGASVPTKKMLDGLWAAAAPSSAAGFDSAAAAPPTDAPSAPAAALTSPSTLACIPEEASLPTKKGHAPSAVTQFSSAPSLGDALDYVMRFIHAESLSKEQQKALMEDVVQTWTDHVNPAFLKYRKSVAEDYAAIEWRDKTPGGSVLISSSGDEYIDCLGGFGIYNLGHSHPVVMEAVRAQLAKAPLCSQELLDPLRAYCAALLAKTLPGDLRYAFFTNSGTESVEACLKFAMLSTGRRHFVGVIGAFHGKTLGSLSGTSKSVFRKPFANSLLPFTHVPVNDIDALRRVFESARFTGNEIAGFLVEPVLGEGGIHVCSDEYLRAARALCDEHGACLIFDEVQSGMGRTGYWWACQHSGVAPDLMAIGKAFGGGVMGAGAAVGTPKVWEKYLENPFLFTTTFGGNPTSMAAAIATMYVMDKEDMMSQARDKGDRMLRELNGLAAKYPRIMKEVRGRGLMIGLEFHNDDIGYAFSRGVFARGILLSGTLVNSRVLRVEPPITITEEEITTVMERFAATLEQMQADGLGLREGEVAAPNPIASPQHAPSPPRRAHHPARVNLAAAAPVAGERERTVSNASSDVPAYLGSAGAAGSSSSTRSEAEDGGDSDTEVSSVSTSSSEEDERRFDPRPDVPARAR